jgi:hypothetical protein
LLSNVFGDSAKALACLSIYFACKALQLVHYPLLLGGLSPGFRRPALPLGP